MMLPLSADYIKTKYHNNKIIRYRRQKSKPPTVILACRLLQIKNRQKDAPTDSKSTTAYRAQLNYISSSSVGGADLQKNLEQTHTRLYNRSIHILKVIL